MLRLNPPPLDAYLGDAATLGETEFIRRYPWPVWVVPAPRAEPSAQFGRLETVIRRAVLPTRDLEDRRISAGGASLDALVLLAQPVRRSPANRLSVGRSPDADVVLLHESVSRFHADLVWTPGVDHAFLTDLGARNGTFVDEVRLSPNGRVDLYSGALVRFGALLTRFYAPRAFFQWLEAGAPRSGAAPEAWPEDSCGGGPRLAACGPKGGSGR